MNVKRYIIASLVVFVATVVLNGLIHGVILKDTYEATKSVWRPDMQSKLWIFWMIDFIVAFPFTYIFVRGREGKGILEGVRYGALMGVYVGIPMAYGTYGMVPIPYSLALQWFLYAFVQMIVLGILVAAVYRPRPA